MLRKFSLAGLLWHLYLVSAGDGCSPSSHCVCFDDPNYYTSKQCYDKRQPWGHTTMRPVNAKPDSPEKQGLSFELFTQQNQESFETISLTETSKYFNPEKETLFLVHGFISDPEESDKEDHLTSWTVTMKDEFLNSGYDYNIIIVNWAKGANVGVFNLDYAKAAQNTRVVGDVTGMLIDHLEINQKTHCIGHSLGSHICGYAGKIVENGSLMRISGLDPAGPYFENEPAFMRLDKGDADFVDCIHTDGKPLYQAGFGTLQAMCDVDFYPNNGYNQPGCKSLSIGCSHGRSCELYVASISKMSCSATQCADEKDWTARTCGLCVGDNCQKMGYHAKTSKQFSNGKYYLETKSKSPWCSDS